jgi:hypothetical protein
VSHHPTGRGDDQRTDKREHGHHDRGHTGHGQRDRATENPDPATDGDRQSGDLVAEPERLVVPECGRRANPTEPVARQPLEKPEHPDCGDDQTDYQRHERDKLHGSMVSGDLRDTHRPPWCGVLHAMRLLSSVLVAVLAAGLTAAPASANQKVWLLGEKIIPAGTFEGTTVGGLSGVDRDPRTGGYVFISDDRSALQPARFYTATIDVSARGLGDVTITGTHPFLRADGATYPPLSANDGTTVDPEDIRVDPWTGDYVWSQEGERIVQPDRQVLIDPSIQFARRNGAYVRTLPLPSVERMSAENHGPRQNLVLEGLTFAAGGTLVVSTVEGPLLQDGPEATPDHGALSRITVQTRAGRLVAQYAYPQEPVFAQPNPPGSFATTGVVAILEAGPGRYLVLERSFVTGVGNKVRLFEITTRGATNIGGLDSIAGKDVRPVHKKLIADMADFDLSTVDNIEGMTWGPRLRDGARSLLLVSDNNFAASQVTQVVALAIR